MEKFRKKIKCYQTALQQISQHRKDLDRILLLKPVITQAQRNFPSLVPPRRSKVPNLLPVYPKASASGKISSKEFKTKT